MIELVILDIDGVLTDGRKYYNSEGMPCMKTYCDKDFTAIKRLRGSGVNVCFLSGDEFVNKAMAKNRNIDFYSARGKDKADFIPKLSSVYDANVEDMLYVGHAYCPADACVDIKKVCGQNNILKNNGGCNVIAELVEELLNRGLVNDCTMQDIEDLDKKEVF